MNVLLQPLWRPDFAQVVDFKVNEEPPNARLLSADAAKSLLCIYPVGTFLSSRFLKPKYSKIKKITLERVDLHVPADEAEVMGFPGRFARRQDLHFRRASGKDEGATKLPSTTVRSSARADWRRPAVLSRKLGYRRETGLKEARSKNVYVFPV
jgi:hypothetical protein